MSETEKKSPEKGATAPWAWSINVSPVNPKEGTFYVGEGPPPTDDPRALSLSESFESLLEGCAHWRKQEAEWRAYAKELEKKLGHAEGAEEEAANKISSLQEDNAVTGKRVEELEGELVKEKREHQATLNVCDSMRERAIVLLEGLPERDSSESWLVHKALSALERLKSEQNVELSALKRQLEGVAFEISRLANGGVNIPSVPHEVKEHLVRIRALAGKGGAPCVSKHEFRQRIESITEQAKRVSGWVAALAPLDHPSTKGAVDEGRKLEFDLMSLRDELALPAAEKA